MVNNLNEYRRLQKESCELLRTGRVREAEIAIGVAHQYLRDYQLAEVERKANQKARDLALLESIWEHLDGIADGADDASHAAQMANQFEGRLRQLIDRWKTDQN